MADSSEASRRREIRRRKILDNSEDRLNRLLRHGSGSNRDGSSQLSSHTYTTQSSGSDGLKSTSETTLEVTFPSSSLAGPSETDHEFRSQRSWTPPTHDCPTPSSTASVDGEAMLLPNLESSGMAFQTSLKTDGLCRGTPTPESSNISSQEYDLCQNVFNTFMKENVIGTDFLETTKIMHDRTKNFTEARESHQSIPTSNRPVVRRESPEKASTSWNLNTVRRILYIFTAVLWRVVLFGDFVPSNAKSAIYPFIILALTVMAYDLLYVEQKQGGLSVVINLFCSLIWSGVSTTVIDRIGTVSIVTSKVVEDIAVYLFTFFLCNWCVEKWISVD